jgi:hypothetical protein
MKFLYKEDGLGLDGNNKFKEQDLEMATKGINKDIKILGDRVAQYFDFDHFNEKWEDLVL